MNLLPLWPIQAKLVINQPGDSYEQEADRIAEEVMRMPEPGIVNRSEIAQPLLMRRSCPKCKRKASERRQDEEDRLQMKPVSGASQANRAAQATPSSVPPIVHEVLRSPGQPLDAATRAFMEPRFGHDFSRVRVHSGEDAENSAWKMNARAYTVGSDIMFGTGQYVPHAHEGQRLIAHELTHVVQQHRGAPLAVRRDTPSIEERAEMLPEQLRSAESSVRGEADDLPQEPSAPVPRSGRRICGPNVDNEINRVWGQVQTDFAGWISPDPVRARNACLYLIQLFTPQTPSGEYAPPGSSLPVALNKNGFDTLGLFQDGAGWQRRSPYYPCCGLPGTTASNPGNDYDPGHEDPGRCSNTVTVGGQCWLMGTVNYGAFGVMMKLCHDLLPASEGAVIGVQVFASIERYIEQIQSSGQTIGQDVSTAIRLVVGELLGLLASDVPEARTVVEEVIQYIINNSELVRRLGTAGAAGEFARMLVDPVITELLRRGALRRAGASIGGALGPARLFSRSSVTAFVAGYKIFDSDDPGPPLRWALATYDGGPTARPSNGNRANCATTCPLTYSGTPFDYVWEPSKPRRRWSSTSAPTTCPPAGP